MNDFIEAIQNSKESESGSDDPSKERYDELKQEEAGLDNASPAERRYSKLKDKARKDLVEEDNKDSEEESSGEDNAEGFITH